ncbi:MAG: hypothetical protein ACI9CD_000856 [Candidatus Deianiraeaceae bacterium]|jgi:hypothetical protein
MSIIKMLSIFLLFSKIAYCEDTFNGKINHIQIFGSTSYVVGGGNTADDGFEYNNGKLDIGYFSLTYSQPSSLFRINARRSVELGYIYGRNRLIKNAPEKYSRYSQSTIGGTYELLFGSSKLYLGAGLGLFFKTKHNSSGNLLSVEKDNRVNSRFMFAPKLSIGTAIHSLTVEFNARHFSNGSLSEPNIGYNFLGMSIGILF